MKKANAFLKRVIAVILIISMLPISSLEDIFVLKARAESARQDYGIEMQENPVDESPDEYTSETIEQSSEEASNSLDNPDIEVLDKSLEESKEAQEFATPETEISNIQLSLIGSMDEEASVCLQWNQVSDQSDTAQSYTYEVCRNEERIAVFPGTDTNTFIYVDENTEASMTYEYRVEVKNVQNVTIGTSNIITITMPEAFVISSDLTLTEDMQVFSLEHQSGTLDLNGYVLTISRDYTQTGGFLNFHEGSLICNGDFSVKDTWARISMTDVNDYLYVKGNLNLQNYGSTYYTQLTNGLLELEGDLTADVQDNFQPSGFHKVVLCGKGLQRISLTAKNHFQILEVTNNSEEGIWSDRGFRCASFLGNDCRITIGDREGLIGYTLEEDTVMEDCYLVAGTMDLNGHTLTVNGDFIQAGGVLAVNGGSLCVKGDYRMQTQRQQEDGSLYDVSGGILRMTGEADYVCIEGSFITDSSASHSGSLTAGTMEVKGDFAANSTYSSDNFAASGSHLLVFCGTSGQKVVMEKSALGCSRFAGLEIRNESSEGVTFEGVPHVSASLEDNGCKVSGCVEIGKDTKILGESFSGDIRIRQNITLKGHLDIGGDLYVENVSTLYVSGDVEVLGSLYLGNRHTGSSRDCGKLVMQKGSLTIGGNLTTEQETAYSDYYYNRVAMMSPEDKIHVHGDVSLSSCTDFVATAGIFELEGNLTDRCGIRAWGSHRFLFSGQKRQVISLKQTAYFAEVELQNHSEEGVYSETMFARTSLIRNGCRLTYGELTGEFGWTLEEDTKWEGNLVLLDDVLDLNGYTLTVKGDLIQMAGEVRPNGGRLYVEGDYRIQSRKETDGMVSYGKSSGKLNMTNEADYICIEGSFITSSSTDHRGSLTAGTMEVKGDFTVDSIYNSNNFTASENHLMVLNGTSGQNVSTEDFGSNYFCLAGLEIRNESSEGVTFERAPYVSVSLKDNGHRVSGSVEIGTDTEIFGESFTGDICIRQNTTLKGHLEIGGDLYVENAAILCVSGDVEVMGNLHLGKDNKANSRDCGKLEMQKGSLTIGGI